MHISPAIFFCHIWLRNYLDWPTGSPLTGCFFKNFCNWKMKRGEKCKMKYLPIFFGFKGKPKPAYIYYFQLYICISQTPSGFLRANPSPRSAIWAGKIFFLKFFIFFKGFCSFLFFLKVFVVFYFFLKVFCSFLFFLNVFVVFYFFFNFLY